VTISPAPYVSAVDLMQTYPLGVSWGSIGKVGSTNPSEQQNAAALDQLCRLATANARGELQQDAHTTFITEGQRGPGQWIGTMASGQGRMLARMFPIWRIEAAAVAAAADFPKNWTVIPPGYVYPELGTMNGILPSGIGGWSNAILISPSYFGWGFGRNGVEVQVSYLHGWPNTQLTAEANADVSTLTVDQLCGVVPGIEMMLMDGADIEQVQIASVTPATPAAYSATQPYSPGKLVTYSAETWQALIPSGPGLPNGVQTPGSNSPYWTSTVDPTGPGTVTLAANTQFSHQEGTLLTALPYDVRWGTALYAKALALQRGLATVTVPGPGGGGGRGGGSTEMAIEAAQKEAVSILAPYRRIL
jgi:hypothetical protein